MAPNAEDCERAERVSIAVAAVHSARRVQPGGAAPAQAWSERERPDRADSPGEERRLLTPAHVSGHKPKPHKSRLQAGLTLGVWPASKKNSKFPLAQKFEKPPAKTKYEKRKEKIIAALRPPYFILSMITIIVNRNPHMGIRGSPRRSGVGAERMAPSAVAAGDVWVGARGRRARSVERARGAGGGLAAGARAGLVARGGAVDGRRGGGRAGSRRAATHCARRRRLCCRLCAADGASAQRLSKIWTYTIVVVPTAECGGAGGVGGVVDAAARSAGLGSCGTAVARPRCVGRACVWRFHRCATRFPSLHWGEYWQAPRGVVPRCVAGAAGGGQRDVDALLPPLPAPAARVTPASSASRQWTTNPSAIRYSVRYS